MCHLHIIFPILCSLYLSPFDLNYILSWLSDLYMSTGRRRWLRIRPRNYFDGSNKYTNGSHGYPSAFFVTHWKNYFDGSNKYTNGSHGYPSAFCVTHLKNLLEKLQAMLTTTKCADCQNRTQSSKQNVIDLISMHGVGQAAREDYLEQNRDQEEYKGRAIFTKKNAFLTIFRQFFLFFSKMVLCRGLRFFCVFCVFAFSVLRLSYQKQHSELLSNFSP